MSLPVARIQEASVIKPRQKFKGHTDTVYGIIHLPDRQRVITCSYDCSLRLWNLKSGLQIGKDWQDGESIAFTISLSPDRKTLASGSQDGIVRLWDVDTGKVITKWVGHSAVVWSICWSGDGRRVLSGSEDGTVRVWDVESGKTNLEIELTSTEHTADLSGNLCPVVYSSDEAMIAAGGIGKDGKLIKIWDAKTFKLVATLEEPKWRVWCLAWTNDGQNLISTTADTDGGSPIRSTIRKWNTTTWKQSAVWTEQADTIRGIAISPKGRILATASYDNTARLWNLENDQPIGSPLQHTSAVFCVSFSADGGLLATGCQDNNAYTWDVSAIVKEAGLNELLLDSDPLQHPTNKSVLDADATRHSAKLLNDTHIPQGFFDDTGGDIDSSPPRPSNSSPIPPPSQPPSRSSIPLCSEAEAQPSSRPRTLRDHISSLFHRSYIVRHATSNATPTPFHLLNSTLAHVSRRRNSNSDRRPPVVEVPCAHGDDRNVHAMKQQKKSPQSSNNVMTLAIPSTSRLPMSDVMRQSSEPVLGQRSSPQPQDLLTATHANAITTTTTAARTPLPSGVGVRQARGWTRFLCCFSFESEVAANVE